MIDAQKVLPHDFVLKLHWPEDQDTLIDARSAIVELHFPGRRAVASVTVPSDQLLDVVAQKLAYFPLISPEGFASAFSDVFLQGISETVALPIDQLVAEAVAPDMLEDELDAKEMLSKFRDRLLKSLEHVEQAIASLRKD